MVFEGFEGGNAIGIDNAGERRFTLRNPIFRREDIGANEEVAFAIWALIRWGQLGRAE